MPTLPPRLRPIRRSALWSGRDCTWRGCGRSTISGRASHRLADVTAQSARALVEQTEVALFAAQAEAMGAKRAAILESTTEAARTLDEAVEAARAALVGLQTTALRLNGLGSRANERAGRLEAAARTNSVLGTIHRSTWPKARAIPVLPLVPLLPRLSVEVLRAASVAHGTVEEKRVRQPIEEVVHGFRLPAQQAACVSDRSGGA